MKKDWAPQLLSIVRFRGAPAVIYCFLYLYISAAGPGPWSRDALVARRRASSVPVS